jgi:hypothetical protein
LEHLSTGRNIKGMVVNMRKLQVIDLFAGLGGWSKPFIDRGHEVFRVDWDDSFELELSADINNLTSRDFPWKPDVVLASPPCETFSVASIGHHWNKDKTPKTKEAEIGKGLVINTVRLIKELDAQISIIENPRGMLRKLDLIDAPRVTVYYCHFGETRAKPTDLWGLPFPENFDTRGECHNQRANHSIDCCCFDHISAPRGSQTGTQGLGSYATKSLIPYELALEVCLKAEAQL